MSTCNCCGTTTIPLKSAFEATTPAAPSRIKPPRARPPGPAAPPPNPRPLFCKLLWILWNCSRGSILKSSWLLGLLLISWFRDDCPAPVVPLARWDAALRCGKCSVEGDRRLLCTHHALRRRFIQVGGAASSLDVESLPRHRSDCARAWTLFSGHKASTTRFPFVAQTYSKTDQHV
jgi:hypothetical protein